MIDNRIHTFVTLCETMNYRATAEILNMTQPAVTQHIHFLENEYQCKLFQYRNKKLSRTKEAEILLKYARSAIYNEYNVRQALNTKELKEIRIGATKSIGEFIIKKEIEQKIVSSSNNFTFIIDNTSTLLNYLNRNQLDFALVEGFFDKSKYGCTLFREEEFVGICSKDHPFAGQNISAENLLSETIIIRESGSGTRAITEQLFMEQNYLIHNFRRRICISDFSLIKDLVASGTGISFVYESVIHPSDPLATFRIKDHAIIRELNYVYLKNTNMDTLIKQWCIE